MSKLYIFANDVLPYVKLALWLSLNVHKVKKYWKTLGAYSSAVEFISKGVVGKFKALRL